jgi:hypothetical protein
MAHEIIKNGIIGSLESLVEMAANVTSTEGYIQPIDIDLLLEQIRKLYREVQILDEANRKDFAEPSSFNSFVQPDAIPDQNVAMISEVVHTIEVVVPQEILIEDTITEQAIHEEPIAFQDKEVIEEQIVEPVFEQEIVAIPERKQVEVVVETTQETTVEIEQVTKEPDLFSQTVSVAEKHKKEEMSINDQLKANQQGFNQKMNETPVTNLKTAIGINDKFMFVNELFKGQMKEYDEMIAQINATMNIDMAIGILHAHLVKYNSTEKTEIVAKLERFIQRRFM